MALKGIVKEGIEGGGRVAGEVFTKEMTDQVKVSNVPLLINNFFRSTASEKGPWDDAKGAIIFNRYREHDSENHQKNHQLLMELLQLVSKPERDGIVMVLIGIIAFTQNIKIEPPKADSKPKGKKGPEKPETKQEDVVRYFEQLRVAKIDWSNKKKLLPLFQILDRLVETFSERKNDEFGRKQAVALLTEFNLYGDATLGKKIAGAITTWKRGRGEDGKSLQGLIDWLNTADKNVFESGAKSLGSLAEKAKDRADTASEQLAKNRQQRAKEKADEKKLKDRERIRIQEKRKGK